MLSFAVLFMQLVSCVIVAVIAFLLRQRFPGHSLSVGRISFLKLTLYDVKYSGTLFHKTYSFSFSSKQTRIRLHWPLTFAGPPHWLTFTSKSIDYTSSTADISTASIIVTFWFFPLLFRRTAGPWTNVEINDLSIWVRKGRETPCFIKRLRQNIVGTVLEGDILRVDDFKTSVRLSGLTNAGGPYESDQDSEDGDAKVEDGEASNSGLQPGDARIPTLKQGSFTDSFANDSGESKAVNSDFKDRVAQPDLPSSEDEFRISAYAHQLHLNNHEGRIYSFGSLDAQFRRNWTADRGSFVLIAEESRWVRVHWTFQGQKAMSWWMQLFTSVMQFPYDLAHVVHYPTTSANIYVSRVDVRFDDFRIRDAELLLQVIAVVREKMFNAGVQWQDLFVDSIAKLMIGGGLESR